MNNQFTSQARTVLSLAKKTAVDSFLSYIGTEHILVGLMKEERGTAGIVLREEGVDSEKLLAMIDSLITPSSDSDVVLKPEYTPRARKALSEAVSLAETHGERLAGTEHILMALLLQPECVASRLLYTMGINIRKLYADLLKACGASESDQQKELSGLQRRAGAGSEQHTPTLDRYSRDLTALAETHKLDPVVGRHKEINRVIEILSRRKKNNPCLIGEPGVGKTAIVEGLAERIAEGTVPEAMKNKRVIVLDLSGMVAGSKYRGEFEERIKNVVKEVMADSRILLFIDEIHTIIGAGGAEGAMDASNILKPSLARGEIQIIGATTIDEYRKRIEKDAALERRFQPVMVEEPSEEDTIQILRGLRPLYEKHHHVKITDGALEAAVKMSSRYINDRFQPDKAIDLIDEASSRVELGEFERQSETKYASEGAADSSGVKGSGSSAKPDKGVKVSEKNGPEGKTADLENQITALSSEKEEQIVKGDFAEAARLQRKQDELQEKLDTLNRKAERTGRNGSRSLTVTEDDIAGTVSAWTGIPVKRIAEAESKRLARLEKILHERVIGQDEAVSAVSRAIRRGRVGLKDPNRPIGSFLFLGPTGVGKTELSKALAEAVFGSENAMIRVDMSEYMEKASVSKLIGSPPGYVGYEEGGQLSEKVRRHPYSVVLFDEIEKAHPDVFNVLLQVLDDGHITDAQGRKVSFRETIIIMTSNAGANRIVQPKRLGFLSSDDEAQSYQHMKGQVMEEVRQMFRPEFLNRIDEILVFHSLTKEDVRRILNILLKDLTRRAREQMEIELNVTGTAKKQLADGSFDSKYGARPLKRAIQSKIEDPLAEEILSGKIHRGDHVTVGCRDGKLFFKTEEVH